MHHFNITICITTCTWQTCIAQQVAKPRKYHHERSTEEVCWGGGMGSRVGMGDEACVTEGESEDESRTTVTYVWVVLHEYTCNWNGGWWLAWGERQMWVIQKQSDDGDCDCMDKYSGKVAPAHILIHPHSHWHACMTLTHSLTHSLSLAHAKAPTWLPRPDWVLQSLSWPGQVDRDSTIVVLQCRFSRYRAHIHTVTHPTPTSISPDKHSSFTIHVLPQPWAQLSWLSTFSISLTFGIMIAVRRPQLTLVL